MEFAEMKSPEENPVYLNNLESNQEHHSRKSDWPVSDSNPSFKYTLPNNQMSTEQRKFYEDNGYVIVKDLIPHPMLDLFHDRFVERSEAETNHRKAGYEIIVKDKILANKGAKGEYTCTKIQNISYDEVFSKYMFYSELLDYVQCFTGPNIMAMHSMIINKPPNADPSTSKHPLHQDLHYFPFRPEDRIVGVWTAMEPATIDNGCLFVLPGTHKTELLQHEYPLWMGTENKWYYSVNGYDNLPKQFVELNKGDTILFHPLLIHGSGPNLTQGFRKAITFHFAASECHYIDIAGSIQENIAKDAVALTKRLKGIDTDYCGIWKYKARVARGIRINL